METLKDFFDAICLWCSNHWIMTYFIGGFVTRFMMEKTFAKKIEGINYLWVVMWPYLLPMLVIGHLSMYAMLLLGFLFSLPSKMINLIRKETSPDDDEYYCHL